MAKNTLYPALRPAAATQQASLSATQHPSPHAESTPTACASALGLFVLSRLTQARAVRRLSSVYSTLLEERVTPLRTLHLLHAQLAITTLVMPADLPLAARLVSLLWSALALRACAQNAQRQKAQKTLNA